MSEGVLICADNEATPVSEDAAEECFSPERIRNEREVPRIISNLYPTQKLEGTSGVYLLTDDKGVGVAVFKPFDEENLPEEASTWAVSNGQGYFRERAAFVVSDEILEGYSGVPTTVIATVRHEGWKGGEKRGSLQRFVPASSDMSDRGPQNIPAEQVHKVGILDILLFNMDRHEGNLLLCGNASPRAGDSLSLVPIDHGLCLPEIVSQHDGPNYELLRSIYFVWQNWPQARQPFSDSVRRLLDRQLADDLFRNVVGNLMEDMGRNALTCGALTTLKIGAMVLRHSVKAGLNLSEIADLVQTALPGVLQASWEEAGKIIKAKVESEKISAAHKSDKDGETKALRQLPAKEDGERKEAASPAARALVLYGEKLPLSQCTSGVNLSVEEDDKVYPVWEALLLRDLEMRLCVLLKATNAAASKADGNEEDLKGGDSNKDDLCANFDQNELRTDWEGANVQPSVRVEYLEDDEQAETENEAEGQKLVRRASLLPSTVRSTNAIGRRSSSAGIPCSRPPRKMVRGSRGRPTPRKERKCAASNLTFSAGAPLPERMVRKRGSLAAAGRRGRRSAEKILINQWMEMLTLGDAKSSHAPAKLSRGKTLPPPRPPEERVERGGSQRGCDAGVARPVERGGQGRDRCSKTRANSEAKELKAFSKAVCG